MIIRDIMTINPVTLQPQVLLEEAARILAENQINGAPVVDSEGALIGLITKGHLLRGIMEENSQATSIDRVMERQVITVSPDDSLDELINLEVGRLPVIDNGRLVGMVTRSDLAKAYYSSARELERSLDIIIESVHNAMITIDESGQVQIFNSAAEKLFDIKKEKIIGQPITKFMPDSTLPDILKSGKTEFSQKVIFQDRTLLSNRTPVIVNGKTIGAAAVVQDISELEQISQELQSTRELKEELDAIINSSFDGIYVTDGEGKTIRINEAYSRITGIRADEVLGKTMSELVESGVYDQSATMLVMERREPVTISQELRTGKSILVTGSPIIGENGQLRRVVTNVRDITELNCLRKELDQAMGLQMHYEERLSRYQVLDKYVIRAQKSRDLIDLVLRLGQVDSTVLIQGESGVGKEMIAEILHSNSLRKDKPLVRINCGAIPENLLESELFGYESGAFTGANKGGKIGIFEVAQHGTLFLDEIAELPLHLQVKLLRVIQEREMTRVGGTTPIKVDVRLIAATNQDLWELVNKNLFRKDLYFRLNVVPITVPPLRERKEEIPALAAQFVRQFNQKYELNKSLDPKVIDKLIAYNWPGNIRELENVIERTLVTHSGDIIDDVALPDDSRAYGKSSQSSQSTQPLKEAVEALERQMISGALNTYGSTRKAARALGVSQPTIVRKAARYGLQSDTQTDA
jgi:PAS domain S-box-containing protein